MANKYETVEMLSSDLVELAEYAKKARHTIEVLSLVIPDADTRLLLHEVNQKFPSWLPR